MVVLCPLPPDDHSRVILSVPDSTGNDYINASFIDVSVIQFEYLNYINMNTHHMHIHTYMNIYMHTHTETHNCMYTACACTNFVHACEHRLYISTYQVYVQYISFTQGYERQNAYIATQGMKYFHVVFHYVGLLR